MAKLMECLRVQEGICGGVTKSSTYGGTYSFTEYIALNTKVYVPGIVLDTGEGKEQNTSAVTMEVLF